MKEKLNLFFEKNKQLKNFSTLAFGTVLSQVLLVAVSPVLTRVFSPSDFGIFSTFTSISVICAIFFSGRYELAIALPNEDEESVSLMKLILKLSIITSVLLLVLVLVLWILNLGGFLKRNFFNESYFLLPIYNLLVINNSSLIYWINRKKKYDKVSKSILISVIFNIIISLGLGLLGFKQLGMIIGLTVGALTSVLFLYKDFLSNSFQKDKIVDVKVVAQEYSSFPKYTLFSDLAFNLNQQYLPIVFNMFYNSHVVGLFSLANRMLRLPNIVFLNSIIHVFRNEAVDELRIKNNCISLYRGTFKKLLIVGLLVYSAIFLLSPYVFKIFFGNKWAVSSDFAQILCVMLFFEFISQPFNSLFYILNNQKLFLKIQSLQTTLSIGFVLLFLFLKKDALTILKVYSFISILFSFTSLYFTSKLSSKNNGN